MLTGATGFLGSSVAAQRSPPGTASTYRSWSRRIRQRGLERLRVTC